MVFLKDIIYRFELKMRLPALKNMPRIECPTRIRLNKPGALILILAVISVLGEIKGKALPDKSYDMYKTAPPRLKRQPITDGQSEVIVEYFSNGDTRSEIQMKDGKKHGLHTTWWPNGYKRQILSYKNGLLHGHCSEFYSTGRRGREYAYKNNRKSGLAATWDDKGRKIKQSMYKDNMLHGKTIDYYLNGYKRSEINYKYNKLHGSSSTWDEKGRKISETRYRDGRKLTR